MYALYISYRTIVFYPVLIKPIIYSMNKSDLFGKCRKRPLLNDVADRCGYPHRLLNSASSDEFSERNSEGAIEVCLSYRQGGDRKVAACLLPQFEGGVKHKDQVDRITWMDGRIGGMSYLSRNPYKQTRFPPCRYSDRNYGVMIEILLWRTLRVY